MGSQEKKSNDGYWLGIIIILVAIIMGIIPVFANFMPKPVDVTKLTFERPIMVPYMVDGVEVDKQAELKLNEDALREFIASETDRHNHYLTVVSIMMALFGIFGSVVAIGMGISLSLKERGIDQQLKEYEAKIEQGTKDAQNRLNEINQEKDKVQEQFYYYVLENVKPALIHEDLIEEGDSGQEQWKEAREEFQKVFRYRYGLGRELSELFSTLIEFASEDIGLAVDLLVMRIYTGDHDHDLDFMILSLNYFFETNEELLTKLFYQPLLSFSAQYILRYSDMCKLVKEEGLSDEFEKLDKSVVGVLEWLNAYKDECRSQQELLAVNAIYKKVKAEVAEKKS